ncbi:right-handed parallel beta-helix repeat-containing protein [Methanobrevibacter sp.]|uniref:right-handed parallel beta-helix repeat-containing protein n=1 Tax=Methanobrevibacter sp. TaxID=66852 RepID=UPI0038698E25
MIICIFSVTSVGAKDLNATDVIGIDDSENTFSTDENIDSSNAFSKSISQNTVSSENNSILNKEITVSGNSFSEIQNAINSANEGDTIILKGTYNLVESQIQVNKKLSFVGTDNAILDGKSKSRICHVLANGVTFKNITFQNAKLINSAIYGGGAIYSAYDVDIDNCSFINNYVSFSGKEDSYYNGGAIFITGSSHCTITNSYFSKNYARTYGGAIYVNGNSKVNILNSTFYSNSNSADGGAIDIHGSVNSYISDCTFNQNSATNGGALYVGGSSINNIVNCIFNRNSATNGGAVDIGKASGNNAKITFSNSSFTLNSATYGGAIKAEKTTYCLIFDSKFNGNSATYGGSYFSDDDGVKSIEVYDSLFENNKATRSGAACYIQSVATSVITNCSFVSNSAGSSAGAVNNRLCSNAKITDCNFVNNSAPNGGSIAFSGGSNTVVGCNFRNNSATDGGAIGLFEEAQGRIYNSSFISNSAKNFGGAIFTQYKDGVRYYCMLPIIHNSKFEENSAVHGGACYIQYLRNGCSITYCTFINNDATNNGGDIRFHLDSDVNVNNCTFKGSRSNLNGGSIQANMVSNIKISYSNFTNCYSAQKGGAINWDDGDNFNIFASIFQNCTSGNDKNSVTLTAGAYQVNDCIFDVAPNVIHKINSILDVNDISIVNGQQGIIKATLSFALGPLSNKEVTFKVNGNSYSRTTSSDGVVTFNTDGYIGGLGNHEVIVSYAGDSVNNAVSKTINVQVNDYRATLIVTQYGKYYGDKSLSFKVVDSDNNLKLNVPVHVDISLNGKSYETKDISTGGTGIVEYPMSSFEPGIYSVKAYVTAQHVDVNTVEEDNIVISKISGVIELSVSNNNKTLNIKLVNPVNGDVYGSIPVKLQFNPNGYETIVTTDSSGFVSVPLMFDPGTYGVVASVDSSGFKEFPIAELQNIVISTAGKDDSVVKFNNAIVFDYLKSGSTTLTLEGCTVTREKVSVDGHPEASIVVSGNKITVSGLAAGSYTLRVVSTPDQYHNSVTRTVGITVNKVDSAITIAKPVSFSYGESGSTNVNVNGGSVDFNGVSVDGHPEAFIGVVNNAITVSNLPVGSYTLRITSTPDSNHEAVTKTTTITVNKVDSKISFDKAISFVYGKFGSSALTLTGCGIVREGVSVDGHPEAVIDVNNNVVSVSNLSVGGYTLRITSVPDSNHNAVTDTIVVTVSKADSDVKFSKAISYDYGGSGSTTLTLTGCSVTLGNIKVDNHPEAVIRINNNFVSVSNLAMGSYTLRITSTPDSNHNAVTRTVGITVNKANSKVEFTNPIVFDYLDVGLTTLILDGCTVPLSNIKVIDHDEALISINNNNVVSVSGLNAGKYTLSVESIPDENHRASTSTIGITVNKINSKISFTEKNISFKYSKSGATSVVLENCKIASMSIVGKNVKPTLKDNVISISGLDVGNYVLKVTTAPRNENYNSVDAFIDVVVTKNTAKITAKSKNFAYKSGVKWAITLKDASNSPISGMKVAIKVFTGKKAKTYSATTNSKGVANFAASKLSVGKHKVVLSVSHKGYTNKAVTSSVKIIKPTELKFKLQQKTSNSKGEGGVSYMVLDKKTGKGINGVKFKCLIYTDKKYTTHYLTTKKIKGVNTVYNGAVGFITNQYSVGKHTVKLIPVDIKYKGSLTTSFTIKKTKAASGGKYFRVT